MAWRGSDTQAAADRKMKRTQQRRSERFRDAEKAAATQRVDKMKAFVHEHNLAESAPTSGDKRRMLLPDTLSAKEQAALGQEWAAAIELMTEGLAVEGTNDPQLTTALESGLAKAQQVHSMLF